MSDLNDTVKLLKRAQELCKRWVKAWGTGEYGYHDARVMRVDLEPPHYIHFVPAIRDSSHSWDCWMDGKYLDDDTNLERDAKAWYDSQMQRRAAISERNNRLRETPEVQEYISLNERQYMIGVSDNKGYYTHPLYRGVAL